MNGTSVVGLSNNNSMASTSQTILPIISSQRDRFKARNTELEMEIRHSQQTILSLRNDMDGMRTDNVKLYEKIKFLQVKQTKKKGIWCMGLRDVFV